MTGKRLQQLLLSVTAGLLGTLWAVGLALAASANLSITIAAQTDPATAGDTLAYNITVSNLGVDQASAVIITLTLDAATDFKSISPGTNCTHTDGVVVCTLPSLSASNLALYTLHVNVDPATRGSVTLTGQVSSATPDPNTGNNQVIKTTAVDDDVNLHVTHLAPQPNPAVAGAAFEYRLLISNTGKSLATGVILTDTLSAGKFEAFMGGTAGANCTGDSSRVICAIGNVAPAGITRDGWLTSGSVITIAVRPKAGLTGSDTLFNQVYIAGVETEPPTGNTAYDFGRAVTRQADMSVGLAVPTAAVTTTDLITYTAIITNHGPSDNTGVVLTSTYPLTFVVVESAAGATCSHNFGQSVCQVGAIKNTAQATVTFRARLLSAAVQSVTIAATVGGDNIEPGGAVGANVISGPTGMIHPLIYYFPLIFKERVVD
jgi:uncharacterized repeat protein (TIGR01451 family)